jgi:hypothetical protein
MGGIDFSRVATSALQAALEDGHQPEARQHHRRLTAGKAIVAGAAVAVAAKYAVDKASPLKRKAAMAALRHTARNTLGDLVPESLHDKLMDSGFFDYEDEDFDGAQGETQDFFEEPEDEGLDEPEDDEEPEAEEQEDAPVEEEDEEPEAEEDDDEPEAEEDDEPEAEEDDDEPEAEEDDDEPEAEEDDEPEAEEDDDEPGLEEDQQTDAEGEGDPGRPRHPLFERSGGREGAQRRSSESPQSRKPKGRRGVAPPRRPSRARTSAHA